MKLHNITTAEVYSLLRDLKTTIHDDYRCSDDPDDATAGMTVTIGADEDGWSYQTGDNSFSGGAYGYRDWAVVDLYRQSNCRGLAREVMGQFAEHAATF